MTDSLSHPERVFIDLLSRRQAANHGCPVVLSPAEVARVTGIPETDQIHLRQSLMRDGRLRLSVVDGRWAYALSDEHA